MKPELQKIFDSTPEEAPRSRLEPYRELILRWRRQGRSIRRICKLMSEEFNIRIGKTALHKYVERRSRPRKPQPEPEAEQLPLMPPETPQPASTAKKLARDERAAQVEYIRSLNKPESKEQPAKPRWNFDADKPRTMHKS